MNDFVDARDPASVEAVLRQAIPVVGLAGVLTQLDGVPGLRVDPGRPRGRFRAAEPASAAYGDRTLQVTASAAELVHVVGGIRLAAEPLEPAAVPGVLAALVTRAVAGQASADEASVLLTALRDAVSIS